MACSLTCKLVHLLLDRQMVLLIKWNLFVIKVLSSPPVLKNKAGYNALRMASPQGSVQASLLFNIYTYDLPVTIGRKFAYADDLAILHYANDGQALEGTLTQNI